MATLVPPSGAYPRPGRTELVSLTSEGKQAHGASVRSSAASLGITDHVCPGSDINADGSYVVFSSSAPLVEEDTNAACDIYLRDRSDGNVVRLSVASDGSQALPTGQELLGRYTSVRPSISETGRYVAFQSIAANLVDGDTNLDWDTFVHDRNDRTTTRVSLGNDEEQTPRAECAPLCSVPRYASSISANGRYVAFGSEADNLVPGDDNDTSDIFVRDLDRSQTMRIVSTCEECHSEAPSISANGRFVVYTSGQKNVFVHDMETGKEERATWLNDGTEPGLLDGDTLTLAEGGRQISNDGRDVVFVSNVEKFIPSDTNWDPCQTGNLRASMPDVFVRDLKTGRTERVSVDSTGTEGELGGGGGNTGGSCSGVHSGASISPNGRFVSFHSLTSFFEADKGTSCPQLPIECSLIPGDNDTFVFDRRTGSLHWTSTALNGGDSTTETSTNACKATDSFSSALSSNGRFALFTSCADNLVPGDTNEEWDFFVRDMGTDRWSGIGREASPPEPDPDVLCIGATCIPPLGTVGQEDPDSDVGRVLSDRGADLIGARIAYRPGYGDLFVVEELEELPPMGVGPRTAVGPPLLVYGLRFVAEGRNHEVRVTSALGGSFELFTCGTDWEPPCNKLGSLQGGFGTTGKRIVFSLPLNSIGLSDGGELEDVEVFTGLGGPATGATMVLDRLRVDLDRRQKPLR
ncbi:MAG: TolB family protein [Actinomycetota bacterium]